MKKLKKLFFLFAIGLIPIQIFAWPGMPTPVLHVEGKYLKDPCGNTVQLHGVAITPSPWFNGCAIGLCRWDNYNVAGCLTYNKAVMDALTNTANGWHLNYIRLHIDPYWTNNPGTTTTGESDISQFNYSRLVTYVNSVIIPLIDHARSRGMYVILRPPGVCPQNIALNDAYYNYLVTVWTYLSQHASLKNQANVMFELANEPINIKASDGTYGQDAQKYYDALKNFFQPIVNLVRNNGCSNVIWVPGLGYQSLYKGLASNKISGTNIGFAVHVYPGYWGLDLNNATNFTNGWNTNVKPVADLYPIAVTEIDWGPSQYNVFGKGGLTSGFGTNFKNTVYYAGNVSWNLLCPEDLINNGDPYVVTTAFNSDPEACAAPCKSWFQAYACCFLPVASCSSTSLVNNGIYTIEFQTNSNKVIDLKYGTDANGTVLRPWDKLGGAAQQWIAINAGTNLWRFKSNASATGRCIDLANGSTTNGTSIRLWDYYANDAQTWQVTSVANGYFKVVSKLNPAKSFDVPNCVMDGIQNLQLWDYYGTSCQLFKFNYVGLKSAKVSDFEKATDIKAEFEIYPNPATSGNFTVTYNDSNQENFQLCIYNLEGKKVYEQNNLSKGDSYITSGLKNGVYIIKVKCLKCNLMKKIIIK